MSITDEVLERIGVSEERFAEMTCHDQGEKKLV